MSQRAYLDYNATAPLRAEVRAAVTDALSLYGNPSSVHEEGRAARAAIEDARVNVMRERLLPVYREWHAAHPFEVRQQISGGGE